MGLHLFDGKTGEGWGGGCGCCGNSFGKDYSEADNKKESLAHAKESLIALQAFCKYYDMTLGELDELAHHDVTLRELNALAPFGRC